MGNFRLTKEADADLLDIAGYTIAKFGLRQSKTYKDGLYNCFKTLSENVSLGRGAAEFTPTLKRFKYKSHSIFFEPLDTGILIIRVLSQRMDYEEHL